MPDPTPPRSALDSVLDDIEKEDDSPDIIPTADTPRRAVTGSAFAEPPSAKSEKDDKRPPAEAEDKKSDLTTIWQWLTATTTRRVILGLIPLLLLAALIGGAIWLFGSSDPDEKKGFLPPRDTSQLIPKDNLGEYKGIPSAPKDTNNE